ncbi:unnamed protein product, partial [Amoebophrya sp. A25]|eukprot:GSA25T00019993001.1
MLPATVPTGVDQGSSLGTNGVAEQAPRAPAVESAEPVAATGGSFGGSEPSSGSKNAGRRPPPLQVSVQGLQFPYLLTDDDVRKVFGRYGDLVDVQIEQTGRAEISGPDLPITPASSIAHVRFEGFGNTLAAWRDLDQKPLVGIEGAILSVKCPEMGPDNYLETVQMDDAAEANVVRTGADGPSRWSEMWTNDQSGVRKYTCRIEIEIENEKEFRVGSRVINLARRIWEEVP